MNQVLVIKQKFLTWFAGHSESEQRLLKIAGGFLVVFVLYNLISSLNENVAQAERKLQQQQSLNSWVSEKLTQIKQLQNAKPKQKSVNTSLTQSVNRSAKRYGINIARIQPQSDNVVRVGIDEIGFSELMNWLKDLKQTYQINVVNIDFSEAGPGMVKLRRLDLGR